MYIVHVYVHVKPDQVDAFTIATIENARESLQEPGVARFDVMQSQSDPTRYVLVEAYRTVEDSSRHKETPHYLKWRDTVASMMAETRANEKFTNVYPDDQEW